MNKITTFLAASSVALFATNAVAGGMDAPIIEEEPMVVAAPSSSSNGGLLILLLLGLTVAAVAGGGTADTTEPEPDPNL